MAPEPSLTSLFVRPLNRLGIPYLVTGGVASVIYGEPRFTRDIDLIVELQPGMVLPFIHSWPATEFYVPPEETLLEECRRPADGHFNLSHHDTAMRADVYLLGTNRDDPWIEVNHWSFNRVFTSIVEDDPIRVAPIETVILFKLRYHQLGGSDRHLRDVRSMLDMSGSLVDTVVLERWAAILGVEAELERVRRFRPT